MKILNLGCGTKTSNHKHVINVDWSPYIRIKKNKLLNFLAKYYLSNERYKKLTKMPKNLLSYNLANGIPFNNDEIDVVYHSHFLEHLERKDAIEFLRENKRVLKKGGVLRVVVPDMELLCNEYLLSIKQCEIEADIKGHEEYISNIIEQCVRQTPFGASKQGKIKSSIEYFILGNANKRGETHKWMYDRFSLKNILQELGFDDIKVRSYEESDIHDWHKYKLDINDNGEQYLKNSLYLEAKKH